MHAYDGRGKQDRACEAELHVPEGYRNGVPIHDDETLLRVDDEPDPHE